MERVKNEAVWALTRTLFLGSALLFLINNYFGFDNALTSGVIPRSQVLIHLHAGSIGWITLSLIGVAIWVFSGQRELSASYTAAVRRLTWIAIFVFGGYIISFGLAFAVQDLTFLLPIFGTGAMLVIWSAAIFAVREFGKQPVATSVHLLVTGGLLVAAIGATMGVMLGLEKVIGVFLPIEGPDRVGVHAGMMDTYVILVAAGLVEWMVGKGSDRRWTWPAMVQTVAWTVAAVVVPIAFLVNMLEQLLPIFGMLLLLGLVFFLVRMGWRGLTQNPLRGGLPAWAFFGTLWLIIFVGLFLYAALSGADFASFPGWFTVAMVHAPFVGAMTNLLLGVYSVRTAQSSGVLSWGAPAALWLINLGLIAFVVLKATSDSRLGAIAMGIGVVLGVVTMILRLRAAGSTGQAPQMQMPA